MAFTGEKSQMVRDMTQVSDPKDIQTGQRVLGLLRVGLGMLPLILGLSACSSVPDAINPVHWYEWALSDGQDDEEEDNVPTATASKARPPAEGLVSDAANAGYAAPVRREVADTKPLVKRPVSEAVAVAAATQAPAAVAVSSVAPPVRPDVPDTVAVVSKGTLLDHYHQRLQESAARSIATPVSTNASGGGSSSATNSIHLTPPKSGGGAAVASGSSFQIASLIFHPGSSSLSPSDIESLKDAARLYKKMGGYVRVLGLGVGFGGSAPTIVISSAAKTGPVTALSRAESAARELARLGVPSEKILVGAVAPGTPPAVDGVAARIYLDM